MDNLKNIDFIQENYYLGIYLLIVVVIFICINLLSKYTCAI